MKMPLNVSDELSYLYNNSVWIVIYMQLLYEADQVNVSTTGPDIGDYMTEEVEYQWIHKGYI